MLINKLTLFYHYEQKMGDVIIKMFVMFISHDVKCSSAWGSLGQHNTWYIFRCSGSHLLKKPGWGLPDSSQSASGSGCCTSLGWYISSGWVLWLLRCMHYRFPWSVWCSCGSNQIWWGCCLSNRCSDWGCRCWSHWRHSRWALRCSWSYISNGRSVRFDSIWMMFMDVIMSTSVLSSNDLNQVWAMLGLTNDCGWQPEGLGIIEYVDSLPCIKWGLLLAVMIMTCSTLGGTVIEVISVSCSLRVLVPDPLWHSDLFCSLVEHFSWWTKMSIDGCASVC